jgi:outer membrane lipoprotein-sorting protein
VAVAGENCSSTFSAKARGDCGERLWRIELKIRKPMQTKTKLMLAALLALAVLPVQAAFGADDKERVLRKLDAAAANFHTTAAEFEFDSVTTEPLPDKDVQKGVVYYERKAGSFQMAAHIREINGKPAPTMYAYSGGQIKLYEPLIDQVTTLSKLSQYESWFMLGFGASGKDLEEKWEIKYLGSETLDGKKTEKLEMVAKDPSVRKNIPKVTIWVDPETGVSLKQVFDQGPGQYRVSVYFNVKVNQPLPPDAFTIKTTKKTVLVNR